MAMQIFLWQGPCETVGERTYYSHFSLNGAQYSVGDCVHLFPESDGDCPHYIGRIQAAFVDNSQNLADPHCIEVRGNDLDHGCRPCTMFRVDVAWGPLHPDSLQKYMPDLPRNFTRKLGIVGLPLALMMIQRVTHI